MKKSRHNSNNRGVDLRKRAVVLGVAAVAALPFGVSSAANGLKDSAGGNSSAPADTSPAPSIDPENRYPAPPSKGVVRIEHVAESGDSVSEVAESMAIEHNQRNAGDHLDAQEVTSSMYSAGGETPEGYSIPPSLGDGLNIGEHIVADVPHEDVRDR
jgi:hypothetical protein